MPGAQTSDRKMSHATLHLVDDHEDIVAGRQSRTCVVVWVVFIRQGDDPSLTLNGFHKDPGNIAAPAQLITSC